MAKLWLRSAKSCALIATILVIPGTASVTARSAIRPLAPLSLESRAALPTFQGDYDHLGIDEGRKNLYIAGEDSNLIEIVDLASNRHRGSIRNIFAPHYFATLPGTNELIVSHSGGDGLAKIIDDSTDTVVGALQHRPGGNSLAYDARAKRIYIIAGGNNTGEPDTSIVSVDPRTRKTVGELKINSQKVQSLAFETGGNRIFTNVTTLRQIAVINKENLTLEAMWPVSASGENGLLALDEKSGLLFVGMRRPDGLVVIDTRTGKPVQTLNLPGGCDHLIFDERRGRLYALGGEGRIGIYRSNGSGRLVELPSVISEPGGKTGLLVPAMGKLFVAVSPGNSGRPGALLTFRVN